MKKICWYTWNYKNKGSHDKWKLLYEQFAFRWHFKWMWKIFTKGEQLSVCNIRYSASWCESLMGYVSPKHYYNPWEKSKLNRTEIKFSRFLILLEHLSLWCISQKQICLIMLPEIPMELLLSVLLWTNRFKTKWNINKETFLPSNKTQHF